MTNKKANKIISECKELLNEQSEPFQRKMKAKHPRMKNRVIGHGGQANTPPFTNKPSMNRSKSAPPIGEDVELDEVFDKLRSQVSKGAQEVSKNVQNTGKKLKRYAAGALAAGALAGGAGAAYKMSQPEEAPVAQAQAQTDMKARYNDPNDLGSEEQVNPDDAPNEKFLKIKKQYIKALYPPVTGGLPKTKEELEDFLEIFNDNTVETFDLQNLNISAGIKGKEAANDLVRLTMFNKEGTFEPVAGLQNLNAFINICTMIKMKVPNAKQRIIYMQALKIYVSHDRATVERLKNELGITIGALQTGEVHLKENKKRFLIKNLDTRRA